MTAVGLWSQTAEFDRMGWWRGAVIYQVYVRSFADGNGDGVGDLIWCSGSVAVPA